MSSNFKCGICLEFSSITEGDYFVSSPCGHIYHYECIRKWIVTEIRPCPICREAVSIQRLVKLNGISPKDGGAVSLRQYTFKFVIIGDAGTGKTSMLQLFANGFCTGNEAPTLGLFEDPRCCRESYKIEYKWDCAGQEKFMAITPNFMRNVNGVIIVYDVTRAETLVNLKKWLEIVYSYNNPADISTILVGNKIDRVSHRKIETSQGKKIADERGLLFMETSAKDLLSVGAVFKMLVSSVLEHCWRAEYIDIDAIKLTNEEGQNSSKKSKCFMTKC